MEPQLFRKLRHLRREITAKSIRTLCLEAVKQNIYTRFNIKGDAAREASSWDTEAEDEAKDEDVAGTRTCPQDMRTRH